MHSVPPAAALSHADLHGRVKAQGGAFPQLKDTRPHLDVHEPGAGVQEGRGRDGVSVCLFPGPSPLGHAGLLEATFLDLLSPGPQHSSRPTLAAVLCLGQAPFSWPRGPSSWGLNLCKEDVFTDPLPRLPQIPKSKGFPLTSRRSSLPGAVAEHTHWWGLAAPGWGLLPARRFAAARPPRHSTPRTKLGSPRRRPATAFSAAPPVGTRWFYPFLATLRV